jgi:menaquinone-dependent protoporphyrinogen IX oxidase
MSGIILCRSKYGASAKYAQWIAEETGFKVIDTKKADIKEVANYDFVILGGGLYSETIAGIAFLKKNIGALKGKRVIVYCCGASEYDEEIIDIVKKKNLKDGLENVPMFYFQGAWDLDSMSIGDRTMCKMFINMLSKKDPSTLSKGGKMFLEVKDKKCDWTKKEYIEPLIQLIKKGEEK